jgi:hypothetical protein
MKEVSKTINYKGRDYKIVFNLNVMEEIQEEYGSLNKWGDLTDGKGSENGETDVKALLFGFRAMLNEGIDIDNEENGTNEPFLTTKKVGRILSDIGIEKANEDINSVVIESVKSDEKNA